MCVLELLAIHDSAHRSPATLPNICSIEEFVLVLIHSWHSTKFLWHIPMLDRHYNYPTHMHKIGFICCLWGTCKHNKCVKFIEKPALLGLFGKVHERRKHCVLLAPSINTTLEYENDFIALPLVPPLVLASWCTPLCMNIIHTYWRQRKTNVVMIEYNTMEFSLWLALPDYLASRWKIPRCSRSSAFTRGMNVACLNSVVWPSVF